MSFASQPKNKRPAAAAANGAEDTSKRAKSKNEADLERLVFGADNDDEDVDGEIDTQSTSDEEAERSDGSSDEEDEENGGENPLFFVDTDRPDQISNTNNDSSDSEEEDSEEEGKEEAADAAAAWVDDDTQNARVALKDNVRTRKLRMDERENVVTGDVYEERLRQQFQKINPAPKWAQETQTGDAWASDDEDSEERKMRAGGDLLQSSKSLLSRSNALLPPSIIDIVRTRNGNQAAPSQSAVSAVQFHPTANVMLTAGLDKTLRLFEVDGKDNQKIQSIFFKDLPISSAQFIRGGQEVVVSGSRRWYYSVDVEKGAVTRISGIPGLPTLNSLKYMHGCNNGDRLAVMSNDGQIHLVSARTKQFIRTLPMNGVVRDVSFTADGNYLWSVGTDNEVYQWDLRQNQCVSRWHDQSLFRATRMEISSDTSYYASGDHAGMVNIYDVNALRTQADDSAFLSVKPFKAIDNLTTSISGLRFNHSSEILGMFSNKSQGQLKLAHLPTGTVFSNWPSMSSSLGFVQCIDFSPHSGFMAVGNDKGKAMLYRLPHFQGY
ncbi:U3 snoRNP protein [Coemansia sp. RSA 2559]|nr:U3 snoRNP protein [Coemansia sp. RSA 2559]KAJ2869732.1 U3 snoRNP protein [Coemansia erecta]